MTDPAAPTTPGVYLGSSVEDAFYEAMRRWKGQRDNDPDRLSTHDLVEQAFASHGLAIEAEAHSTPAWTLDVDQFREWVIDIVSGYPMKDGKPLGLGGLAFEQCRSRVLHLLDEWQPVRSTPAEELREALEQISHNAFDTNDECRYCGCDIEDEHDDRCPCVIADAALAARLRYPESDR